MKIDLYLVGIGTGNPEHVTQQAINVLRSSDIILVPNKGSEKSDLASKELFTYRKEVSRFIFQFEAMA